MQTVGVRKFCNVTECSVKTETNTNRPTCKTETDTSGRNTYRPTTRIRLSDNKDVKCKFC